MLLATLSEISALRKILTANKGEEMSERSAPINESGAAGEDKILKRFAKLYFSEAAALGDLIGSRAPRFPRLGIHRLLGQGQIGYRVTGTILRASRMKMCQAEHND
ncbi:hypothetical protein KM043_008837 [Ampulex compressa]|nr:hypothetical protein KM043_008837 [Ampulex compressa]